MDHASDCIFNFNQTSTESSQTVEANHKLEPFAENCGASIRHYHADNKTFTSQAFKESYIAAQKTQSFCGVNAHHQNGVAERKIKTVFSLARTMLFAAITKWPNNIHVGLWSHVVYHAVDTLNNIPHSSGFTPKDIFTCVQGASSFRHFHAFGSPSFV